MGWVRERTDLEKSPSSRWLSVSDLLLPRSKDSDRFSAAHDFRFHEDEATPGDTLNWTQPRL